MDDNLGQALDDLMVRVERCYADANQPLVTECNSDWQAPIYCGSPDTDDWVEWRPVRQQQPLSFDDLANALEQPFHGDFVGYFSRWFSADLAVSWTNEGQDDSVTHPLWLLQMHGDEDAERMLANQAGHVLMKRRLKQPITLFLGLAEESDDLLITLDNQTGAVGLEFVGQEQHEVLAPSLSEFLNRLTPRLVAKDQ